MFPIAVGAINLPIRSWRGAGSVHHVTVAGWAHTGKLKEGVVYVIEESPVICAQTIFIAIERSRTQLYFGRKF